jgi:hypothetical protein
MPLPKPVLATVPRIPLSCPVPLPLPEPPGKSKEPTFMCQQFCSRFSFAADACGITEAPCLDLAWGAAQR